MKKILIVSPHFPPVNAADMQRVRLALPYLRAYGWDPTVLAIAPESVEGSVIDETLVSTYPADIRVIRVRGLSPRFTRAVGIGSLWWRCAKALRAAGNQLLDAETFDLVFFSTTQFGAFTLGPYWHRHFRVPYVLDYQDPWINDYYRDTGVRPPGGPLKFWLSQFNARRCEPDAIRSAAGIVTVSPAYGPALQSRYPWLTAEQIKTIPFGSSSLDLEIARKHRPVHNLVPFDDGHIHHVYAGRCGPDMTIPLTILFRAFKRYLDSHPADAARHRFHFIGTDYAPPPLGHQWALPIADQENVSEYVDEHCYRVPYFDALHYITKADALVVIGSDDPTYSASKIYPYLFSHRPLLTIAHERSPMLELARSQAPGCSFGFSEVSTALSASICQSWFIDGGHRQAPPGDSKLLAPHTATGMTQRLAEFFEQITAQAPQQNTPKTDRQQAARV